ncbi:MAG TPA: molybdopterin converting factor subunit 1 [Chloroflexota bacterium]|nr:molybdopterin converting factor subunit 1 [Chloroflexota bacterium]
MVRVRLRYFASIRERLGRKEEDMEVPDGATVAMVWERLLLERPDLASQRYRPAGNQEYTSPEQVLAEGDELVFIPPVSGGSGDRGACQHVGRVECA